MVKARSPMKTGNACDCENCTSSVLQFETSRNTHLEAEESLQQVGQILTSKFGKGNIQRQISGSQRIFQQVGKTEDAQLHHRVTLLLWTYLLCLVLCTVSFSSCTLPPISTVFEHFGHVCVVILRVIWDFVWYVHRSRPSSVAIVHSKTVRARAGHWFTLILIHHSLEELFVKIVYALSLANFLRAWFH